MKRLLPDTVKALVGEDPPAGRTPDVEAAEVVDDWWEALSKPARSQLSRHDYQCLVDAVAASLHESASGRMQLVLEEVDDE